SCRRKGVSEDRCRRYAADSQLLVRCGAFLGPASQAAIFPRGRALGRALRPSSKCAEPGSHPTLGTEDAFQQGRQVEVCIQLWKMDAEAGWTNLDGFELRSPGVLQTLHDVRRKRHIHLCAEANYDAATFAVVMRIDRRRNTFAPSSRTLSG